MTGATLRPRAQLLGCEIDNVEMDEVVEICDQAIAARRPVQHMSVNAAKIVAIQDDPELRRLVNECEIVTADGQAVVWASRLLGTPLPSRVTGIDLMLQLLGLAERKGYRVFVLGARQQVLERALAHVRRDHPRLRIAGARHGYFPNTEERAVVEEIRRARPDMLFVAMSSPRKERFLGHWQGELEVPFRMGVGGSIDVIAGITRRAPRTVQRAGLEWAWRLAQEPRRLFRRYLVGNARFVALGVREAVSRLPAGNGADSRAGG